MDVAVLGGGLTGCSLAMTLAKRGAHVVLFERRDGLLLEASTGNEGKIHLGYVYAADRSMATARTMLRGALSFHSILRELLGERDWFTRSSPFIYAIHCDSQLSVEDIQRHFAKMHADLAGADARGAHFLMRTCMRRSNSRPTPTSTQVSSKQRFKRQSLPLIRGR